ncbi:MAG TPA: hypothetical protein DCY89_03370 [Gammaproteobacteria bacterium]|nr:hypothetical protein [Gammaproteobacteria bacterium]
MPAPALAGTRDALRVVTEGEDRTDVTCAPSGWLADAAALPVRVAALAAGGAGAGSVTTVVVAAAAGVLAAGALARFGAVLGG